MISSGEQPPRRLAWGLPVIRGSRHRRSIALTFDDGPSEATLELLDTLAEFGVLATFFQCGQAAERLPAVARAVAVAGHEIGNHGYSHPSFLFRGPRFIAGELERAQEAILTASGVRPRLFRPPYGFWWFGMPGILRRMHLAGVMWTVIGYDWKLPAEKVAGRVMRALKNGAIICLHDGCPPGRETAKAVRQLIPAAREAGYRFETAGQLICLPN